MKWYYEVRGGHTHVRVFMNGAKCGYLCFRNEEFALIRAHNMQPHPGSEPLIIFIESP